MDINIKYIPLLELFDSSIDYIKFIQENYLVLLKLFAHFIIDYGMENDLMWVCFQDDTSECWTWENADIRARVNETIGRSKVSKIKE